MPDLSVPALARQVTDDALRHLRSQQSVAIRAHPGAGKTGGPDSGTVRLAQALAQDGLRVALLIPQNDQVVESLDRLRTIWPGLTVHFAPSSEAWKRMPDWIRIAARRPRQLRVIDTNNRALLASRPGLFVMTAERFAYLHPAATTAQARPQGNVTYVDPFDVVIVDEAWMAPAALWLNLSKLAYLVALVGDSGQIMPWTPTDAWYPGMIGSPIEPLPDVATRMLGTRLTTLDLAVSRRLAGHTTPLVGALPAYASTGTRHMYDAAEVPVTPQLIPLDATAAVRRSIDRMAAQGLALHRLPSEIAPVADPAVARACAQLAAALLRSQPVLGHPDLGNRTLEGRHLAVLTAHHAQRVAVEAALEDIDSALARQVATATFNTIQGATVPVTIVWHPISGRSDVSDFHADVGRLTVGVTRHTHGCIVVCRDGVEERLDATRSSDDQEGDAPDRRLTGLLAHRTVWRHLVA